METETLDDALNHEALLEAHERFLSQTNDSGVEHFCQWLRKNRPTVYQWYLTHRVH